MKIYKDSVFQHYIYNDEQEDQGWKIHIFSTFFNYSTILTICRKICQKQNINFKYVHDENIIKHFFCKHVDYNFAGKFITIYAGSNNERFKETLELFHKKFKNLKGFKIIGDRNYCNSVVNYRYGNYNPNRNYIVNSNGEKIVDKRDFYLPYKMQILDPMDDKNTLIEETDEELVLNNKYEIKRALSLSNLGGVYLALDITSQKYRVLKEYRFSNFTSDYTRKKERKFSDTRPLFIESFKVQNSIFFVYEYIEGKDLSTIDFEKINTKTIIKITQCLLQLVLTFHVRRTVLKDIKLDNFIWDSKNEEIFFVDREHCKEVSWQAFHDFEPLTNEVFGDLCILNIYKKERVKVANLILKFFNIRGEVYHVKQDYATFWSYIRNMFHIRQLPKGILGIIGLFFSVDRYYYTENAKIVISHEKFDKSQRRFKFLIDFENEIKNVPMPVANFSKELSENNLYGFIFEKIINKKTDERVLNEWSNSELNPDDFEDNMKLLLLWKYKKINFDIEEKVKEIVDKFLFEKNDQYFVKYENFFVPYIEKGPGILAIIITEILPELENWKESYLFDLLIMLHKGFISFPVWVVKTPLLFGTAGIVFLIDYLANFFNSYYYKGVAKTKMLCIVYMQKNLKWQTQDNVELDDSFLEGNAGILWVSKKVLDKP